MTLMILLYIVCLVNCSLNSVSASQLLVTSSVYSTLQNAVAGVTCTNSNYMWSAGGAWNTMKYATCTDQGGSGVWVSSDSCICELMFSCPLRIKYSCQFSLFKYYYLHQHKRVLKCQSEKVYLFNMQFCNFQYICIATCPNPPDQNRIFNGYVNQSIYIGFTISMTCANSYDWNDGENGSTPMIANCTVSNGQAIWTTTYSCTSKLYCLVQFIIYYILVTLSSNLLVVRNSACQLKLTSFLYSYVASAVTTTGIQIATLVISSLAIAGVIISVVLQSIIFLKM